MQRHNWLGINDTGMVFSHREFASYLSSDYMTIPDNEEKKRLLDDHDML